MSVINAVVRRPVNPVCGAVVNERPRVAGATRGPELVTVPVGTGWSVTGTGASVDGTGAHFAATASLATAFHSAVTEDGATYEVIWTIANLSSGGGHIIVYGATTAHGGGSSPNRTANGTFTETVTTSGAGSSSLRITIQTTGGSNTFDVTSISVKKVLA